MLLLKIFEIVCIIVSLIVVISLIREMTICFKKDKRPWIIILWDIFALLIILAYTYLMMSFGIDNVQNIQLTHNIKSSIILPILILIELIRYVINELSNKK